MAGDRSREFRRLAFECLSLARQASDDRQRAPLVMMAQRWIEMAERAEHDAYSKALRYRTIQAAIGARLRTAFPLPECLPPHLLALLAQLGNDADGGKGE